MNQRNVRPSLHFRLATGFSLCAAIALVLAPAVGAADPQASASIRPTVSASTSTASSSAPTASATAPSSSAAAPSASANLPNAGGSATAGSSDTAATPIKHLVVLMQENHTFDNYFGTFPGADGIPAGVCMPRDPANPALGCVTSHHLDSHRTVDLNHGPEVARDVENSGAYNGFVVAQTKRRLPGEEAMGYYDGSDLPFYWNLASSFVLADRFFSSDVGGSRENHMFWVAGQSGGPHIPERNGEVVGYDFDTIFDRLQAKGVSWKFYVQNYDPTVTFRTTSGKAIDSQTIWVPLVDFPHIVDNPELSSHIVDISQYRTDLAAGTLPSVAFMVPSGASEHPPGDIAIGQVYGASQVSALLSSTSWKDSLFVLTWDDWGGWYDHVVPPSIDSDGYGLRVPALFVSPYSHRGGIDSTTYDFTSILRFIEDNWGVPPLTARDASANSIAAGLDFTMAPRPPELPEAVYPATKEVSPSARLALLGIYGLIVVAVPGAAAYLWRRRRGGGEPLFAGHGPAHLGDPGRGDLADAAAPTLSLPDPGPDRSSVIADPGAGSAFGAAPTAGPAKSALGVPAAAVLAAGSLKGRIARAAHFPVAPEATEVPDASSVNGQVADAGGTKTPVVADMPEVAATAAVAASAAEQPTAPRVTTPKAVTSRKRAGQAATPPVEAAAARSASDAPTVPDQTERVAATTVTKSRRRQRAKTIASTSDLSNDPSSVAPASDPGGTAARTTRRTASPRPAEPSTTAAITPPTVPETAPVTEPSNNPDAAIEPSAMPEVVAPATDHSTSPKRPSTRRPRRTTEAEP